MKKAESEGRYDDYGKLAYEKERLQGKTSSFEQNIQAFANNPRFQSTNANGQQVFKVDQEYASLIKAQTEAMKRLTAEYETAIRKGDIDAARAISPQIEQQQDEFRKIVEQSNAPAANRGMSNAVHAIGLHQIAGAINEGFSRYVTSLDRSGIVSQYGSGDVLGGRVSEQRRQANLWGGVAQAGLGLGGTVLGFLLGGPGGAMVGGALGSAGGSAISNLLQKDVNKAATEAAYAGLWNQRSAGAMELAALQGAPNRVREAFDVAARAAEQFGFSAEEGMEAMKQAAQQGLDGSIAHQIFQYERSTGADRGTMTSLATMSARFGGGDALGVGYAGLQASGMRPGQYNEYLRAMQRVMEDGISKGFIRSSDQVARNLTMLAQLTNNSPFWQGEQGARRLMDMNAGLEQATALQSTSDIIAFRAARTIAERRNGQQPVSYIEAQKILEQGLTPELFKEYMSLTHAAEGGSREGIIERMRQTFGLNYTTADQLFNAWDGNNLIMSDEQLQAILDRQNIIPQSDSKELRAAIETQSIANWWTRTGQTYWDRSLGHLREELVKAIREYNRETGSNIPLPLSLNGQAGERIPYAIPMTASDVIDTNRDELAALMRGENIEIPSAEEIRRRTQVIIDEDRYLADMERILIQSRRQGQRGGIAFFTGDGNPFTQNEDERAYNRLLAYGSREETRDVFFEVLSILESFDEEQRRRANEYGATNAAIPNVMTDTTGQQLLAAIRELADRFNVTINF
jgi:hypothetical protein